MPTTFQVKRIVNETDTLKSLCPVGLLPGGERQTIVCEMVVSSMGKRKAQQDDRPMAQGWQFSSEGNGRSH